MLALFFLPYILPVSVVYLIWDWTLNFQFGIAMHVLDWLGIPRVPIFKSREWFMPAVAVGDDLVDRGLLDPAVPRRTARHPGRRSTRRRRSTTSTRWTTFRRITWPLLWPVTTLVFTIQLILQLKIFDQVYLFSIGGRPNDNMVLVYYVFQRAFQQNQGGRAAAVAVTLFVHRRRRLGAAVPAAPPRRGGADERRGWRGGWNFWGGVITALTLVCAVLWAFPIYWGVISSLKPEDEVVRPYIELWPGHADLPALHLRADPDADRHLVRELGGRRGRRDGDHHLLVDALRLRDLAAALPRADRALVADPRLLHGADFRR